MRTRTKRPARATQTAALQNLQTAIVRLADKRLNDPAIPKRVELNTRVEHALDAYRKYMEVFAAS